MSRRNIVASAFALTAGAGIILSCNNPALADTPRIEISPDGHTRVDLSADAAPPAPVARSTAVPYPATPDWVNTLRRQVGGLAVHDMNGDGWPDVIVGCYISQSFPPYTDWKNMIYYNIGGELEAEPSWISADEVHTGDIVIGNVNRDGYPDIVSVNGGTAFSPTRIYYGGPGGPSTVHGWQSSTPQATWATAGTLFDFDHDGDLDLFTTNQGVSPNPYRPTYGFRNNDGVLETTPFWQSDEASIQGSVAFADLDGDGWEDLAVSKWVNFDTAIHRVIGGVLQTSPHWTSGSTVGDRGVAWADVDHDGWPDLAVGRSPMILYTNDKGTLVHTWTAAPPFATQPQDMKFFDVNRDGYDDLIEIQFSTGRVHIYLNNGGTLSTTPDWTWDDAAVGTAIAFGDINGDGWPDLVAGFSGEPCVKVFYARIPEVLGDMNCDGLLNQDDVPPFVLALLDPAEYEAGYPKCDILRGDMTGNELVDGDDINPFVAALLAP
jgi:hypothetical protein